jgi:hypothetical protein
MILYGDFKKLLNLSQTSVTLIQIIFSEHRNRSYVIGFDLAQTFTRPAAALECFDHVFTNIEFSTIFTQFSSKKCLGILSSLSVILLVIHFKVNKIQPNFQVYRCFK